MLIITLSEYDNKKAIRIIKHRFESITDIFKKYKKCNSEIDNITNKLINTCSNVIKKHNLKNKNLTIKICSFINNDVIDKTKKIQTGLLIHKNDFVIVNDLYESYIKLLEEILNTFKNSIIDNSISKKKLPESISIQ